MEKRVLITGCAGFIGSNLSKMLLDKAYEVIGMDDLSAGTRENIDPRVDFRELDIRDARLSEHFQNVDTVFHLAAKTSLTDCLDHPLEAVDVNVKGTVNVLEAVKKRKVRKLIFADTSAEYEGVEEFPSKVDKVCPIGVYAVTKRAASLLCESYVRLYGLTVTIVRYFNVYGPAQDWRRVVPPVMSSFILRLLRGDNPLIYGDGTKRRDFIYVDDVNALHDLIMNDARTNGNTYNVGTGISYSVREIYDAVENLMKTGIAPVHKPDLPGEAKQTLADITQEKALGWEPKVNLKEGLARTIDYLKKVYEKENRQNKAVPLK